MEIIGVSRNLLVFISVLSLASATTTTAAPTTTTATPTTTYSPTTTTTTPTTTPTTTITTRSSSTTAHFTTTTTPTTTTGIQWPAIFYPFGSVVGDVQTLTTNIFDDSYATASLTSPFVYFGRTYSTIYVNNNGLLSFNQAIPESNPYTFPSGGEDLIAPLWTELDDYGLGAYYYQEYTFGNVLTRATEDIKRYYPGVSFNATWVFVATWDYVNTWDQNTFLQHSAPSISFQAVLISDGVSSFILMNYGDMSTIVYQTEAGYDTVGSTHYFVIPESNDGNLIPNLKSSSNVNTPGRWVFSANQGIVQFSAIFYPFGSVVGDVQTLTTNIYDDSYATASLTSPFVYFGRTYSTIYVNNNGLLSFNQAIPESNPYTFPSGGEDLIAPLWTELDDYGLGAYYYQEYTSGNVLTRATEDIKRYYPGLSFNASWVFVATWDYVNTWDQNTFLQHLAPSISFQAVLISDGVSSFILMNYGDMSTIVYQTEAGYDTVGSTHYFVIPESNDGNLIPNLKSSSNVNTPGRWVFSANQGIVQFSDIFYPVGLPFGDVQTLTTNIFDDSYATASLTSPFVYFGRTYNTIYVNNNGLLSFNQAIPEAHPYIFPSGGEDLIAPLWTELDDYGLGAYYYQEYTSGNVLTRATEDIRRYYPGLSFSATWVFVATWDYVQTWDSNTFSQHSAPSISFQAVLISDGVSSFILMNYGDMSTIVYPTEAGFDTVGSSHYYVIPLSNDPNLIPNLKSTSNVNTPGRWAFLLNRENVVGLQMKVTSFLDLTDSGNLAFVMQKLKDELVILGLPSDVRVTARRVEKTP
ncbi:uncharacterized protein [Paramisgurnus dabryanus]|uniref:uncharacterized protein n=1 Tax=Paramisgurnus dabryanus TaxID=90735 RepID=UPI0031F38091